MAEVLVTIAGAGAIAALAWFFFGPRTARGAELRSGRQEVEIVVKGGYSPNLIRARAGVPLRLVFDRQEAGDCTSRVVFPDLGVSRSLAPFARTTVEFTPERSGEFGFACGMNMVHGTLLVETDGDANGTGGGNGVVTQTGDLSQEDVAEAVGVGPRREVSDPTETVLALRPGGISCASCVATIEQALLDPTRGRSRRSQHGHGEGHDRLRPRPGDCRAVARGDYWLGLRAAGRGPPAARGRRCRGRRPAGRNRRPQPAGCGRGGPHGARPLRGDGLRRIRRQLGAGLHDESLVPAGPDYPGDALHRLADPPKWMAQPLPPQRRHEHADRDRDGGRLQLQPLRHPLPEPAAERPSRRLLRGGRRHPHLDPARPAARGPRQGGHR